MSPEDSNQPQPDQGETAAGASSDIGNTSAPSGPGIGRAVLVALLIIGVVGGSYVAREKWRSRNEDESRDALKEMGAVVVMHSSGKHVFLANLSLPKMSDRIDEAIQLLPDLVYVENVDLSQTSVTDEQLANVAGLKHITAITLNNTQIGDDGLSHIAGLDRLTAIYLNGTNVTGKGLAHLGGLPDLKIIDLSGSKVDGDLAGLAKAKSLDHLLLGDLNVSDAAIDTLIGVPSLLRLSLMGSQVSTEALERLQKANPDVMIDTSQGTFGSGEESDSQDESESEDESESDDESDSEDESDSAEER